MAKKRPLDQDEVPSHKAKKKQKTQVARAIDVQQKPGQASKPATDTEGSGNPKGKNDANQANRTNFTENSMQGMPSVIDVEKFAEARQFEINAMQKAMVTAKTDATKRVWQTLPRHLRRRAASHDVRRVPVRLREKARAEMDPAQKKKKIKSLPKRGKGKQVTRTASLLKRQLDKTWLETHIWHAKRMKMDNLWGYRLPLQPTEKAFRPSHRASVHGSIINDVSYFSTSEIKAREDVLINILARCCDIQTPLGSKRFTSGGRICETHIYKADRFPLDLIGPISILWKPQEGSDSPADLARTIWIRSHPAIFELVHKALQQSASLGLDSMKQPQQSSPGNGGMDVDATTSSAPAEVLQVEIADLRTDIVAFEIMGPRSSQVLAGALKIVKEVSQDAKKVWKTLPDLKTPGSVPRGMVIGLKVHDPRLSFPPGNAQPKKREKDEPPGGPAAFSIPPTAALSQSELWDETVRESLQKPKFKKKELDDRRGQNLTPGTPLRPMAQDDRIPLILIQRTVSPPPTPPHSVGAPPALHGWTVLLPAGWAMAFWSSLIYTGTRVGGLRERASQHFETSTLHFPHDYVTTPTYDDWWKEREEDDRAKWERTPKGKRVSYEGVRSPWRADWEVVLGLPGRVVHEESDANLIPSQRDPATLPDTGDMVEDDEQTASPVEPWLLRGSFVSDVLKQIAQGAETPASDLLHKRIANLRAKKGLQPLAMTAEDLAGSALVSVRVTLCGRGAPDDLAAIYDIPQDELAGWGSLVEKKKTGKRHSMEVDPSVDDADPEVQLSSVEPDAKNIIGYVTTGSFSLQLGQGYALGSVAALKYMDIVKRAKSQTKCLVKVRDRNSKTCRPAWIEINPC